MTQLLSHICDSGQDEWMEAIEFFACPQKVHVDREMLILKYWRGKQQEIQMIMSIFRI